MAELAIFIAKLILLCLSLNWIIDARIERVLKNIVIEIIKEEEKDE